MNWMGFLTYVLVTAFTPGPNNIMSLSNATQNGLKRALPFNFGIWTGFSVVVLLCTVLSATLYTALPSIETPMRFIGAAYMLYLAWKIVKSSSVSDERSGNFSFVSGLALQFINPKGIIYGIVSMETFILPYYHGQTFILIGFALLLSTVGFISTVCWASFGSLFKLLFSKYRKTVNIVLSLLLVYCAVSLFI